MKEIIKITTKEIELINKLIENDFKFSLDINSDDVDNILEIKLANFNLYLDINYLICNEQIEELRFHKIDELISYLKNN